VAGLAMLLQDLENIPVEESARSGSCLRCHRW
jgi:hypothetical protein